MDEPAGPPEPAAGERAATAVVDDHAPARIAPDSERGQPEAGAAPEQSPGKSGVGETPTGSQICGYPGTWDTPPPAKPFSYMTEEDTKDKGEAAEILGPILPNTPYEPEAGDGAPTGMRVNLLGPGRDGPRESATLADTPLPGDTPPPAEESFKERLKTWEGMEKWVKTVHDDVTIGRYHATLNFHDVFDPTALALDVGCFVGWFTNMIPIPAVGIDANREYIAWARHRFKTDKTFFEVMDARSMSFLDDFFHIAYVCEVLEHFDEADAETVMNEVIRVTKPGASIIVCVPSPGWSFMVSQDHKTDFREKWFETRYNVVESVRVGERYMVYHIKKA